MKALKLILIFLSLFCVKLFASDEVRLSLPQFMHELKQSDWKTTYTDNSNLGFNLMAINKDFSQVLMVKPTLQWEANFKPNQWYDLPQGSAYFFQDYQVAIYIFDLEKRAISGLTKSHLFKLVSSSLVSTETKIRSSWIRHLLPLSTAYANPHCEGGNQDQTQGLSDLSYKIYQHVSFGANQVWDMLYKCGNTVIQDTIKGISEMVTHPLNFISQTWDSIKGLVNVVENFTTIIPQVFAQVQKLSPKQLFDLICPVATKLMLGIVTGKIAMDGAKIAYEMLKEIKLIQKSMAQIKAIPIIAALIAVKPKLPLLKVENGRLPKGTVTMQNSSLASMEKGKLLINGQKLKPGKRYSGVILDDGRMLLQETDIALHNELVMPGDKVGTAFEILTGKDGNILVALNQSGTYLPTFEGTKQWMQWWMKTQKSLGPQGELPFSLKKFPGSQ
ncbi:MAG: hypothetical protein ACOYL6_15465 [Bacteriovoracaceae bacterium]